MYWCCCSFFDPLFRNASESLRTTYRVLKRGCTRDRCNDFTQVVETLSKGWRISAPKVHYSSVSRWPSQRRVGAKIATPWSDQLCATCQHRSTFIRFKILLRSCFFTAFSFFCTILVSYLYRLFSFVRLILYPASGLLEIRFCTAVHCVVQARAELVAKGLDEDLYTAALMQGIHPEDGGGAGTPFITLGDGNCLLNSIALLFVTETGRSKRAAVSKLAAKLRLSVVLEGLRHMEAYMSMQEEIFCCWNNYTGDVYDKLTAAGWCVAPDTIDKDRVGSRETARLFFVAQLHNIAVKGQWLQQFVLPILATVVQAPVRVFVPCKCVSSYVQLAAAEVCAKTCTILIRVSS